jgi:hypothetical protein
VTLIGGTDFQLLKPHLADTALMHCTTKRFGISLAQFRTPEADHKNLVRTLSSPLVVKQETPDGEGHRDEGAWG